jgi:hypothetical protein
MAWRVEARGAHLARKHVDVRGQRVDRKAKLGRFQRRVQVEMRHLLWAQPASVRPDP